MDGFQWPPPSKDMARWMCCNTQQAPLLVGDSLSGKASKNAGEVDTAVYESFTLSPFTTQGVCRWTKCFGVQHSQRYPEPCSVPIPGRLRPRGHQKLAKRQRADAGESYSATTQTPPRTVGLVKFFHINPFKLKLRGVTPLLS